MSIEKQQDLYVDKLASGDRPSIYALGLFGADSLKKAHVAVFMVDILGRVHIMSPDSVQVLQRARVPDEDLDTLSEEEAIHVLLEQGDAEEAIIEYLKGREVRGV